MNNDTLVPDRPSIGVSFNSIDLYEGTRAIRLAVNDNDWELVNQLANKSLGDGYAALRSMQSLNYGSVNLASDSKLRKKQITTRIQTIADAPKRQDILNRASKHFPNDTDLITRLDASLDRIASGDKEAIKDNLDHLMGKSQTKSLLGTAKQNGIIASLSRGLLGLVHADFNKETLELEGRPNKSDLLLIPRFRECINEMEQALTKAQSDIYFDMVDQSSNTISVQPLETLVSLVERSLPGFVRKQARSRYKMLQLLRAGKGSAAETLGKQAARAGMITRQAIASHAAAYRLLLEREQVTPTNEVKRLINAARTTPFSCTLPNGKNIQLKDVPDTEDQAMVDIEGFVAAMRVKRLGEGKLVTQIRLFDPSSKQSAYAVSVFTHLPHVGLTLGAYCRLTGKYSTESVVFDKQPVVEIDRLSLSELTKNSWQIGFTRLAESWYSPWRNGTNMSFSLGKHKKAVDINRPSHHGASELIYPEIVKD